MAKNIVERIRAFNADRIPDLLPLKYKNMSADPFAFFRGSAHLFYEDWPAGSELNAAPHTWICGDLHLENFGTYKGKNRLVYFDINDFDEGMLAPCTWDLARFLSGLRLAGASLNIADKDLDSLCDTFLETYFATLAKGRIQSVERATASGLVKKLIRSLKSRQRNRFLDERTRIVKTHRKYRFENNRYQRVNDEDWELVSRAIQALGDRENDEEFYRLHDVAFRIAGTGSLGVRRYAALVEGRGFPNDNFILDLKEGRRPSSQPYNPLPQPAWVNQAERAVAIQTRLQANPPALLTTIPVGEKAFVVRELQPTQDRINLAEWGGKPKRAAEVTEIMAEIVAWSELRSGGRNGSAIADELIAFGEQAALRTELLEYTRAYALKMNGYYQQFSAAMNAGKL